MRKFSEWLKIREQDEVDNLNKQAINMLKSTKDVKKTGAQIKKMYDSKLKGATNIQQAAKLAGAAAAVKSSLGIK